MLKISEFSRLVQVPAKTLRYYDEIGLFEPAVIDRFTGYRYYTVEQLPRLNRILALKALGLSLSQIRELVDDTLTPEQIRGMLRLKHAETLQRLEEEQMRLAYVEAKLKQIESEGKMSDYEVIVKPVEAIRVAALRGVAPDMAAIGATVGEMFGRLGATMQAHHAPITGPSIILYHDAEYMEKDINLEAAFPTSGSVPEADGVQVHTLPAVEHMATTVHRGAFSELGGAYNAILAWIDTQGYQVTGPTREVYLQFDPAAPPSTWVTEIQFPVAKR
jgi:DNA-binding transcriptional MerR regulator